MRAIVLYSQHESGQQAQAQALAQQLGAYASAVDVIEVYGSDLGWAVKDLLAVREFPAVVLIQDHLQGASLSDNAYLQAVLAEQHDIEEREFRRLTPGHLQAVLATTKEEGREEIRKIVREAAALNTLDGQAKERLKEKGVL